MPTRKLLAATLLASSMSAHASVIVGGSSLLDAAGLSLLEHWLGNGSFTLTNIFSKGANDNSFSFHAAVDGRGPTISLMSALGEQGSQWKTVGGFNPLNWDTSGPHASTDPADWTAFIFNLSDQTVRRQSGPSQTINAIERGPSFGVYHVADDLTVNSALSGLYSSGFGYGDTIAHSPAGPDFQTSIVDRSTNPNAAVGALEVFAIRFAPNEIPEPGSASLVLAGALAWLARRRPPAAAVCRRWG